MASNAKRGTSKSDIGTKTTTESKAPESSATLPLDVTQLIKLIDIGAIQKDLQIVNCHVTAMQKEINALKDRVRELESTRPDASNPLSSNKKRKAEDSLSRVDQDEIFAEIEDIVNAATTSQQRNDGLEFVGVDRKTLLAQTICPYTKMTMTEPMKK